MDYCLGAGDGTASIWTGQPDLDIDGDGDFEGLRMDLDGDGLFDDALVDADGDGLADHLALDLDDDGTPESMHGDDGFGTWAMTPGPEGRLRWLGLDGAEHTAAGPVDFDVDGLLDRLLDTDRDGSADRVLLAGDDGGFSAGYLDTDGDGRWDLRLLDVDGDGAADQSSRL